jgi:hypothetical protein
MMLRLPQLVRQLPADRSGPPRHAAPTLSSVKTLFAARMTRTSFEQRADVVINAERVVVDDRKLALNVRSKLRSGKGSLGSVAAR